MKLINIFRTPVLAKIFICTALLSLTACSEMPKAFWAMDEGDNGVKKSQPQIQAESRPALDIPPMLRGAVVVPDAGAVAVKKDMPERYKKIVAGKSVALDARLYDKPVEAVFSSVVDAMTSLNFPVQSVDSASGTVTTDWIRKDADNSTASAVFNVFNGDGVKAIRHRFVVRVLRQTTEPGVEKSRLEIRTLGQVYQNKHWRNKKIIRKKANELFVAVEERLARP